MLMLMVATQVRGSAHDNRKLKNKARSSQSNTISQSSSSNSNNSRRLNQCSRSSSSNNNRHAAASRPTTTTKKKTSNSNHINRDESSWFDQHSAKSYVQMMRTSISKLILKAKHQHGSFEYTPMAPIYSMKKL